MIDVLLKLKTLIFSGCLLMIFTKLSKAMSMKSCHFKSKRIVFVRHGQATHNPRAEAAKANGCSHEAFLNLMKEDDQFDAELTTLGIAQAEIGRKENKLMLHGVDLVVSSPLSRTLKTADLILCPEKGLEQPLIYDKSLGRNDISIHHPKRICLEELREINGWLLNAKRRQRGELTKMFHERWDFDLLSEEDETWGAELEEYKDCGERGYLSLLWLLKRNEEKILVVSHGGILRFSMDHELVQVDDSRNDEEKRFSNCEMREYELSYDINDSDIDDSRPLVKLTEITNTY